MRWLVYGFLLAVSLGLLRRDGASEWHYLAWVVMAMAVLLGMLFL